MSDRLRVLELFCGIGGCAASLGDSADVVAAVDINRDALAVYSHNFSHATYTRAIESLPASWLAEQDADLWWMSPPCQPYTRRGSQRDLKDPRSAAFLSLLERIAELKPPYLAVENVPEFDGSMARMMLLETLGTSGYQWHETQLCPTELGIPNRRRRYYLVASREILRPFPARNASQRFRAADVVSDSDDAALRIKPELHAMYREAMDVVDANDAAAVTSCFTAAYGRSVIRSGSYLQSGDGIRRFHPVEILRLLGFSADFTLPPATPHPQAWRLIGNSLSIPAVQHVLAAIPSLGTQLT